MKNEGIKSVNRYHVAILLSIQANSRHCIIISTAFPLLPVTDSDPDDGQSMVVSCFNQTHFIRKD